MTTESLAIKQAINSTVEYIDWYIPNNTNANIISWLMKELGEISNDSLRIIDYPGKEHFVIIIMVDEIEYGYTLDYLDYCVYDLNLRIRD